MKLNPIGRVGKTAILAFAAFVIGQLLVAPLARVTEEAVGRAVGVALGGSAVLAWVLLRRRPPDPAASESPE